MHTPSHHNQISPATYKTTGSTPLRDSLGPFLKFQHSIPQPPLDMFNNNNNNNTNQFVDIDYTDTNYNLLINNAEMINQNYDAAAAAAAAASHHHDPFNASSPQDIDLDLLFPPEQVPFVETKSNVDAVVPTIKIDKKNMNIKDNNKENVAVVSPSLTLKHHSLSMSSPSKQIMSPLKKSTIKEKRVSMKGMGAAMKRIRMTDTYDETMSSSSSDDDDESGSSDDEANKIERNIKNFNDNDKNDDDIGVVVEDRERILIKPKSRGRYAKKMCVSSAMKPVHVETPTPSDPATDSLFREIITKQLQQNDDVVVDNSRIFTSHFLDTSYYMFIISKSSNVDEVYSLRYINCVHSVHNEYTAHHMHHDRFVLVVTIERYRFMISYNLLLGMNIEIPTQDQFSEKQLSDTNKNMCIFEEVKDFKFLSLLINTFRLDQVYIQGKVSLLLASVGESKSRVIFDQLTQMMDTGMMFTLPMSVTKKEAPNQDELKKYDMSMYVEDIMKYTTGLHFNKFEEDRKLSRAQIVDSVSKSLSFWYENKQTIKNRNKQQQQEKSNFTYKYGCIARQFYDPTHKGVKKLFKVKKENGSTKLIENYLNACKERFENYSFILITTKSDERITIIKNGMEFLWITSVIKDIIVTDIIKKYKMYNHYVYNLNNGNRKEINIRHNGMIKLLSNYTGGRLTLNEATGIAVESFNCNFEKVIYDKKNAKSIN